MHIVCISSGSALMRGVEGVSIRSCTLALIPWTLIMEDVLVSLDVVSYGTHSEFVIFRTHYLGGFLIQN